MQSITSGRIMCNRMIARAWGERMAEPQAAADMLRSVFEGAGKRLKIRV